MIVGAARLGVVILEVEGCVSRAKVEPGETEAQNWVNHSQPLITGSDPATLGAWARFTTATIWTSCGLRSRIRQLITRPYFTTNYGSAYLGDSAVLMQEIEDESVNLVVTSPPFALTRKKVYGNKEDDEYVEWFMPFAAQIRRVLRQDSSFVLDLGGA